MPKQRLPLIVALGLTALCFIIFHQSDDPPNAISSTEIDTKISAADWADGSIPRLGQSKRDKNPHQYSTPLLAVAKRLGADTVELRRLPSIPSLEDEMSLDLGIGTARLKRRSYRSENFQVVIQGDDGSVTLADPGEVRTYVGRLSSQQDATVTLLLRENKIIGRIADPLEGNVSIDPLTEEEMAALAHTVPGEGVLHAFHSPLQGAPANMAPVPDSYNEDGVLVSALAGDGVVGTTPSGDPAPRIVDNVCVREAELGIDVAYSFYSGRAGSNVSTAKDLMEAWIMNEIAVFERDCLVRHVLGTLVIRTSSNDGYGPDNGHSDLLELVRSNWNTTNFPANLNNADIFQNGMDVTSTGVQASQHDLATAVLNRSTGVTGFAYVGTVGTDDRYSHVTANAGLGFWRNGGQHEIGHTWSLQHEDGCNQEPWINGSNSTGIICGDEQGRANAVEVSKISAHRDSRAPGVLPEAAPSGPLAPYAMIDRLNAVIDSDNLLDVLANDHDVNNDNFFIGEIRTRNDATRVVQDTPTPLTTDLGGTLIRSIGTGPNGRDELMYTPPANAAIGAKEGFFYLVEDLTGQRNWGFVEVTITDSLLFSESFVYDGRNLFGKENSGITWDRSTVSNDGAIEAADFSLPQIPEFDFRGKQLRHTSPTRHHFPLPDAAQTGNDGSTIYISFIQSIVNPEIDAARIIEFWDGGASDQERTFSFGTYPSSIATAPDYGLYIERGSQQLSFDAGTADSDTHLILLKVEYGANDNDTVSIYINPGATEPETPNGIINATDLSFNRIGFGTFQNGIQRIDEFKIATEYERAVPLIPTEPFFEEEFEYSTGALAGETNSGNDWQDITGSGSTSVLADSLDISTPPGAITTGGRILQTASDRLALLLPNEATGGTDGSTLYVSFAQKLINPGDGSTRIVEFWQGDANDSNRSFSFGTYVSTVTNAPDYGLFVERDITSLSLDVGTVDGDTHLVVLKVQYGIEDADSISVYIDPGEAEPLTPIGTVNATDLVFNRIGIGSFQGGSQELDSIRIGATYSSVVPAVNPDSDEDGLPDVFEMANYGNLNATDGTDDLDKDGQNDRSEFIAGTDPNDKTSVFAFTPDGITQTSPNELTLRWFSVAGKTYSVWSTSTLNINDWSIVTPSVNATGAETSYPVTPSGVSTFYQIRVNE